MKLWEKIREFVWKNFRAGTFLVLLIFQYSPKTWAESASCLPKQSLNTVESVFMASYERIHLRVKSNSSDNISKEINSVFNNYTFNKRELPTGKFTNTARACTILNFTFERCGSLIKS